MKEGEGGGLLLGVPMLASISEQDAKKVAIGAALVLEIILLLGRLVGLPMSSQKATDEIAKWLQNSRVLQAIQAFINRLKNGTKDLLESIGNLLKELYETGALESILGKALQGAFGLLEIIWMIL